MQTTNSPPLISIGMPVHNEARFIRQSLESLCAQTEIRFEIIISDNASDDGTEAICREFAELHPQLIRYHRFDINQGASANFAWVLKQAAGEFFIWASGHDLWDNNYLFECSKALSADSHAMIAFGSTRWIDDEGQPFARASGWSDTRGLSLLGRYFTVFWGNMNPIISLIRTAPLKQQEISAMTGIDLCLLLALALKGDFIHCSETSWARREFRKEHSYNQKLERYRSKDFALDKSFLGRHFPLAKLPVRIFSDLFKSDIRFSSKMMLGAILLNSILFKYITDKKR